MGCGAFAGPDGHHVHMIVKNRLSRGPSIELTDAHAVRGECLLHCPRHFLHRSGNVGDCAIVHVQYGFMVAAWNHQQMSIAGRRHVHEGKRCCILVYAICRCLARGDQTEYAIAG